ncbi:MAG: DUF7594 domain-containing protein [Opitutales bacterium]
MKQLHQYPEKEFELSLRKYSLRLILSATVTLCGIISQVHAESEYLGSKWRNFATNEPEPKEFGTLFDHLVVQGNWNWKVEEDRDKYDWKDPDAELAFAHEMGLSTKYQGLWYPAKSQSWLDADNIEEEVVEYTRDLLERYVVDRGYTLDMLRVINEIGNFTNRRPNIEVGLLDGWQGSGSPNNPEVPGEDDYDWLINLFTLIRNTVADFEDEFQDEYQQKYGKELDLGNLEYFINDYGLATSKPKRNKMIGIINTVNDNGNRRLIDALGIQAHGLEEGTGDQIKENLNLFAETGVDLLITEYDVAVFNDEDQLAIYQDQFPVMWEHPAIKGVTLWGHVEGNMWARKAEAYMVSIEGEDRPAMTWLKAYMATNESGPVLSFPPTTAQYYPMGSEAKIQVKANDRNGMDRVELYVNGSLFDTVVKGYQDEEYGKHDFSLESLGVGTYDVTAVAYDTLGNSSSLSKNISIIEPHSIPSREPDLIIYAIADAFVRGGENEDNNYGSNSVLSIKNNSGKNWYESFMKFDLSDIDQPIEAALLELTVETNGSSNRDAPDILARYVEDNSWEEDSLTFVNRPVVSDVVGRGTVSAIGEKLSFHVAPYMSSERSPDRMFSVNLSEKARKQSVDFYSSEYTTDSTAQPRLLIYFSDEPIETFTATVNNGSGDGDYAEGYSVGVTADEPAPGQVFDVWTGDVQYLDNPSVPTTTLTMPAAPVTVTATYTAAQSYVLTVVGGSGSGTYPAGISESVSAGAAPDGQVFDVWTGDVSGIESVDQADTTLIMPNSDTSITATYVVPAVDSITIDLDGYENVTDDIEIDVAQGGFQKFDIRANTTPAEDFGRVTFSLVLDGVSQAWRSDQNVAYELKSRHLDEDEYKFGEHTLTVTPYDTDNVAGTPLTLNINVIDSSLTDYEMWSDNYSLTAPVGDDTDGDGVKDYFEYLYKSDPKDPSSRGLIVEAKESPDSDSVVFEWAVAEGFVLNEDYILEVSNNLSGWDVPDPSEYTISEVTADGFTLLSLELHDAGPDIFVRLIQPESNL